MGRPKKIKPPLEQYSERKQELCKCAKCDGYNLFEIKENFMDIPPLCIFCGHGVFNPIYTGEIIQEKD